MDAPILLDRDGLFAVWRRLTTSAQLDGRIRYEVDAYGEVVTSPCPSARRQTVLTDVFCHLTEQLGHLAAMSVAVTTRSFGIRVPDVVWMSCEKWEGFDRDDPVPFVPDLCVEVLLDGEWQHDVVRRIDAYLTSGAAEVIVVGPHRQIGIWGAQGRRQASIFGVTLPLDYIYFEEGEVAAAPGVRR
jgi:Uma2 family endonuclease